MYIYISINIYIWNMCCELYGPQTCHIVTSDMKYQLCFWGVVSFMSKSRATSCFNTILKSSNHKVLLVGNILQYQISKQKAILNRAIFHKTSLFIAVGRGTKTLIIPYNIVFCHAFLKVGKKRRSSIGPATYGCGTGCSTILVLTIIFGT